MKYELHAQTRMNWDPWYWTKLSTHKSYHAAIKAAVKSGPSYRAYRIHKVEVEDLPRFLTHENRRVRKDQKSHR